MGSVFRRAGIFAFLFLLLAAFAAAQPPDYAHIARQAVTNLSSGNFAAVEQHMIPGMAAEVPLQILQMVWMHVIRRFGDFQKITGATVKPVNDQQLVAVACQFAKGPATVNWIINSHGQITGLHFQ
ncbi:MAG: DUF3887 domain-containing protein [Terriglobales bacterium]